MNKYFDILRRCLLFDGITDDDLQKLLGCLGASVRRFRKREAIMAEGDAAGYIGIMLSGSARIEQTDYFGNRSIVAGIRPAELFGESFACAGVETMPVSVMANEESEAMLIECQRITHSCSNACSFHRQIIYNLMKVIAAKNLIFHQKIEITSKRSTREKLMTYLMFCAQKNNSSTFEIPFDRQELADYLEVERSGLSAEISKLRREGVLLADKNRFTLLENAAYRGE